jgi:hypothetical protein
MERISQFLAKSFRDLAFIDYRTLALFRIGFGLVLFVDFLGKASDLTAFFTDRGILPRALATESLGWWSFSFHMASGAFWFQAILMAGGLLLSLCLIFGYQTRLVTVLTWLFVVSLQGRNQLILHSGDALARLMLFWSMFLPLDARYSLDRLVLNRRGEKYPEKGVANVASLAILVQVLFMYFFTSLLKDHPEWNRNFQAVYYAMSLEQFTTPLGQSLLAYPALLKVLTAMTYYLELAGPILLFIPLIQIYMRSALPFAFIGLHFSLFLCMYLGTFPWICMACWILFFPSAFMDAFENACAKIPAKTKGALRSIGDRFAPHLPLTFIWRRPKWLKIIVGAFLLTCLAGITFWNVSTLPIIDRRVPTFVRTFILPQRLDQYWSMFSPHPMRADGWFVVDGVLNDGTSYDTWNHMTPHWEKPERLFPLFRSTPWRKYLTNVWVEEKSDSVRLAFGKYVCREWNDFTPGQPEEKRLKSYQLYYMRENTAPPGEVSEIRKVLLWNHNCFGSPEPVGQDFPPKTGD